MSSTKSNILFFALAVSLAVGFDFLRGVYPDQNRYVNHRAERHLVRNVIHAPYFEADYHSDLKQKNTKKKLCRHAATGPSCQRNYFFHGMTFTGKIETRSHWKAGPGHGFGGVSPEYFRARYVWESMVLI